MGHFNTGVYWPWEGCDDARAHCQKCQDGQVQKLSLEEAHWAGQQGGILCPGHQQSHHQVGNGEGWGIHHQCQSPSKRYKRAKGTNRFQYLIHWNWWCQCGFSQIEDSVHA